MGRKCNIILSQLLMRNKGWKPSDFDKVTAISFEEISQKEKACFDRKQEILFGPYVRAQVLRLEAFQVNG